MQGFINSVSARFADMVERVSLAVPDATYGVATFSNYGHPNGTDLPSGFSNKPPAMSIRCRMPSTESKSGGGLHEASYETLFQTLTGLGYDQNCNGLFDEGEDVRPFSPTRWMHSLGKWKVPKKKGPSVEAKWVAWVFEAEHTN